ncbi:FecR family protein [Sphingobacterium prati]|uniref:FecR family protein n=1 Tax=Sphingobacterium prati TaxID=2737006 RepID=UPI0015549B3E|nr:FecR domain-containing protein [Sphingobacterium prati]NPE45289.1 hypothetical protein [Sphingobacterium prati]
MNDPKIASLYKKYVLGELNAQEKAIFLDLLTSCEIDELPNLEEIIALDERGFNLDTSTSDHIFYAITGTELNPRVLPIWKRTKLLVSIAAILLMVGFIFLFSLVFRPVHRDSTFTTIQYFNPTKFVKRVILKDGTKISLRQGARVAVISDFDRDSLRKVVLSGEAFFEVAKDPNKAFLVVNSGDFDVRVLGTAFNLACTAQQTRLVLNHGKVQVKHGDQHSVISPGQQVDYDPRQKQFSVVAIDTSAASNWKSDFLSFNEVPLSQIVDDLNNLYPAYNLELIDSFQTKSFTGYLPASDLEKSLKILNTAFNQTIIHKK